MIWTGDHLDAVRRLQQTLFGPARAAEEVRLTPTWRELVPQLPARH